MLGAFCPLAQSPFCFATHKTQVLRYTAMDLSAVAKPPRQSDVIVFSHANSFPAGTYRKHFAIWQDAGFEIKAIDKFGHDPRYPVTNNWTHLERELVDFLDEEIDRPAYLVGHSMGGYLSLMAACSRPDKIKGVILLDSPVVSGWKATGVRLAKALGIFDRFTHARSSINRQQAFGQFHRRCMRAAGQDHLLQRAGLPADGRGDARLGVAVQVGPPAADAVEDAPAVEPHQPCALAALHRKQRQRMRVLAHLRAGMPEHGQVACPPVICGGYHGCIVNAFHPAIIAAGAAA